MLIPSDIDDDSAELVKLRQIMSTEQIHKKRQAAVGARYYLCVCRDSSGMLKAAFIKGQYNLPASERIARTILRKQPTVESVEICDTDHPYKWVEYFERNSDFSGYKVVRSKED